MRQNSVELFKNSFLNLRLPLATLLLAVVGCGTSDDTPKLTTVTGAVVRDGKPLEGVYLEFHPAKGRMSNGTTDAQGKFALLYAINHPGAMLGEHTVYFLVRPPLTAKQEAEANKYEGPIRAEYLRRVSDPKKLKYEEHVTVKSGKNDFSFDLSGKS